MKRIYAVLIIIFGYSLFAQTTPTGSSTQVGVTQGQLSVSGSGAATYGIPIVVPSGINGVVPDISLHYDSQAGNGFAGYGWNMTGISVISRIPSTKFHDFFIDPIDFDNLDRFALDGQRLILKSGGHAQENSVYETENFSNVKITSHGVSAMGTNYNPGWFLVEYPDGSKAHYQSIGRSEWGISYWENAQGVRISYTYNYSNNSFKINKILYGSIGNNTPVNEISFVYKTRQRPEEFYIGGQRFYNDAVLSEIKIKRNGAGYRNYLLEHDAVNLGYQRLIKITETSGDGTQSLNPTVFSYNSTNEIISYNSEATSLPVQDVSTETHTSVTGDFDGDGRMDLLLYKNADKSNYWVMNSNGAPDYQHTAPFKELFPANFLTGTSTTGFKLMPHQGWIMVNEIPSGTHFTLYTSGSGAVVNQYLKTVVIDIIGGGEKRYYSGDFNGDGLTDIISVAKSNGQSTLIDFDKRKSADFAFKLFTTITISDNDRVIVADFDGDGKSDLWHFKNKALRIYGYGYSGLEVLYDVVSDDWINLSYPIYMGDYNGDGKSDFIIPMNNNSYNFGKYISTGKTLVKAEEIYQIPYYQNQTQHAWHIIPNDLNNDGKTDLILAGTWRNHNNPTGAEYLKGYISVYLFRNMGNNFVADDNMYATTGTLSEIQRFPIPIFLNSNQKNKNLEVSFISNNKIYHFESHKDFNKEKLLNSVTVGNGVKETITYASLANICPGSQCNSTYVTDGDKENFPNFDIIDGTGFYIVKKLEKQSNSSYQQQDYRYLGAVTNLEGLGFLGFKKTFKTNWYSDGSNLLSNICTYDMTKRGALSEELMVNAIGSFSINPSAFYSIKTVNTYSVELSSSKVYNRKLTKTIEYDALHDTQRTTSYTYNLYNHVLTNQISQSVGLSIERTEANTFEYYDAPAESVYYIGRPKRKTTTLLYNRETMTSEELYEYNNHLLSKLQKKGHNTDFITEENVYDAFGNITKKTISAPGVTSRVTNFEYDPSGHFLTKSTDVAGLITTYVTNPSTGLLTSSSNQLGITNTFLYDSWGKNIKITDYLGKSKNILFTVLPSGMDEISTTSDDGSASYSRYDDLGREIISGVKNIGGSWSYIKKQYNIYGKETSVGEPINDLNANPSQVTVYTYDVHGRPLQTTSYTGKVTNVTYNLRTTVVNDGVQTTTTVANSKGDVISKNDGGGIITYRYYPNGNLKETSCNGATVKLEQDGWGRKTKLIDPSAGTYTYEYNNFGEITKETGPKGFSTYSYTTKGLPMDKNMQDGATYGGSTSYYYYSNNLPLSKSWFDAEGNYHDTYYTYDTNWRLIEYEENSLNTNYKKNYAYDAFGRVEYETLTATYQGQTSTTKIRNTYKNGHKWQIYDDLTNTMLYQNTTVNARGQQLTGRYGNGISISNTYDQYGFINMIRHYRVAFPESVDRIKTTYLFDPQKENLTTRNDNMSNFGAETFQYDNLDRLTHFTNIRGEQEQQVYDDKGRIASNNIGTYVYDSSRIFQHASLEMSEEGKAYYENRAGLFDGTMENKKSWDELAVYDSSRIHSGNYSMILSGSSLASVTSVKVPICNATATTYTVSGFMNSDSNTGKVYLVQETATGNVMESVISLGVPAIPNNWITFNSSFSVQPNVKKLSVRLEKLSGANVWFDDIRITKTADITAERQLSIRYNMFKAPTEITEPGVDKINIIYNGQESRSEMYYGSTNDDIMARPYRKFYSSDASIEIKHNIVDNTIEFITYIGGDGYTAPVVFKKNGTLQEYLYLHRDNQASIIGISDQTGKIVERRRFDAWGNIIEVTDALGNVLSGLTVLDRGYTGHEHLQTVGLINMNGRIYDAKLHRFLQPDNFIQDPTNSQNFNRYSYVLNNPLKYTDFSGENFKEWWSKNWKDVVVIGGTIIVGVGVTILTAGTGTGAYIAVVAGAGSAGFFSGSVGTLLNGGSAWDALSAGMFGAGKGIFWASIGYAVGLAAPAGIIAGGLFGGASNTVIGGFMNLSEGGNFFDNWGWNAAMGTFGGSMGGRTQAKANGADVWTGAKPKTNVIPANPLQAEIDAINAEYAQSQAKPVNVDNTAVNLQVDDIHFMQSSIKNTTGKYTVLGNADALRNGSLNPKILQMNVWKDAEGKIWTLDHRRLAAFKLAGFEFAPASFAPPSTVLDQMWKMTTTNGGTSIRLNLGSGQSVIVK